jgi:hypothetical protein
VLDGRGDGDAPWSPSVQVAAAGVAPVADVGATGDDLIYTTDAPDAEKAIVDDGYRIVGMTVDGLPKPEFHFVGDDANLVLPPNGATPIVVYQDATTQELLLTQKGTDGLWGLHETVAGGPGQMPWAGAYGFFASAAINATDIVISTWVIDQPDNDNWVEVFFRPYVIQ